MARVAVSPSPALKLVPSARSLAVGFGLLASTVALYVGARETSVFAVRTIEVEAATPAQARLVRGALADLSGTSLLRVDAGEIERLLERLPHVHLLEYDRAYPNELRVRVAVEPAAAVLRRGTDRWLVSSEGRILRPLRRPLRRPLPVVWTEGGADPAVGVRIRSAEAARGIRILAAIRAADARLARRVWYMKPASGGVVAVLRNRVELHLGNGADLALKLAVARRVLALLEAEDAGARYIDVSVPQRPVAGATLESQIEP